MRGSATQKDDNLRVLRSLTNEQVLRTWQLAPHFWELRVLRLKMFQNWARYSEDCALPIAAMLGCFLDSDLAHLAQADLSTGKLRDCKRSPWMQQFVDDIAALVFVDGGFIVLDDLEERFSFLFTRNPVHEELQASFIVLNVIEVRAWKVSNSVPPPTRHTIDSCSKPMQVYKSICVSTSERFTNAHSQTQHVTQADLGAFEVTSPPPGDLSGTAQSAADLFSCLVVSNGVLCGADFQRRNALDMHVRFSHNVRCRVSQATRTNTCVYCSSSFKSVVGAR